MIFVYLFDCKSTTPMRTHRSLGRALLGLWLLGSAGLGWLHAQAQNDTYLTRKEREKLNKQAQTAAESRRDEAVDSREDNFERSSGQRDYDEDYSYSRRIRRYSTGVWCDPWFDPWWSWRRSAFWGPVWGYWGPSWSYAYWGPGWSYTYTTWYSWGPTFYAGPTWGYYDPYWGWGPNWGYWGAAPAAQPRRNYVPRTYTAPSGGTTYTPPRGTITSPSGTPPRRSASPSAAPSRPSYSTPSGGGYSRPSPSGGARPSTAGGSTGGGGIRSSGAGGGRPR